MTSKREELLQAVVKCGGSLRKGCKAIGIDPKQARRWREQSEREPNQHRCLFVSGDYGAFHLGLREAMGSAPPPMPRLPPKPEPKPEPVTVTERDTSPKESKRTVVADPRAPWEHEGTGCEPFKQKDRPLRDGDTHVHPVYGPGFKVSGDTPVYKGNKPGQQQRLLGPPGWNQSAGPPGWYLDMRELTKKF